MDILAKYFNTGGPSDPSRHYVVPAVERVPVARQLVEDGLFFVLHGPRQSGKTTFVLEFIREINSCGRYHAFYLSLQEARGIKGLSKFASFFVETLNEALKNSGVEILAKTTVPYEDLTFPQKAIRRALNSLCSSLDKPVILFIDEVETLQGKVLKSFLDQIRCGFVMRNRFNFPHSLGLVAMRDLEDLRLEHTSAKRASLLASPFNIARDLYLPNFSFADINKLYEMHVVTTGQIIEDQARVRAWEWSEGQPWLVNALIAEVVEVILNGDLGKVVTEDLIDRAAQELLKNRPAHLRHLMLWLEDPRIRRAVGPVIAGSVIKRPVLNEGIFLALDLGLLSADVNDHLRPANRLYRYLMESSFTRSLKFPASLEGLFINKDNILMTSLLREFQRYWREMSRSWLRPYQNIPAVLSHLATQTFLKAATASQTHLVRGSVLGEDSLEICAEFSGKRYPLLLMVARPRAVETGLEELSRNLESLGVLEGWLLVFDFDYQKTAEEKMYWKTKTLAAGRTIHVLGF
ncbi:MAG: ATP-binding protein [Deltaproteobacteria bacterium]|jgi:hypothetical protein|nr:ATP-binding protein [Deltaproteobacteria bacterium]